MKKRFTKVSTAIALVVIMVVNMAISVSAANIVGIKVNGTIKYDEAFNCLDVLNRERAAVGLNSLTMDSHLMDVAITRAYEACVLFSHDRPNGKSCTSLQNTNTYYGENLASGYNTGSQVMSGWMSSSGHKANILNANYRSVGIACVNGTWVQEFSGNSGNSAYKPSNRTEVRTVECNASAMSIKPSYYYSGTQNVKEGDTIQLHAPLLYMNGEQCYNVDDSAFSVSSSDRSIASVSGMTLSVLKGGDFTVNFALNGTSLRTSVNFHSESKAKSLSGCTVTLEKREYVYTDSSIMPKFTIKAPDGTVLKENTDYTVRYGENIETCWGSIYLTGIGNYAGSSLTHSFEISRAKLSECTISIPSSEYTYTGKQIKPPVTVKTPQGKVLKEGEDYDYVLSYGTNVSSGWGSFTVKGRGNYSGIIEKIFQISKKDLSDCSLDCTSFTYDGKPKTPKLTEGKEGKDYTITYSNNTEAGTATAYVEMLDFENYYGDATFSFTINPDPKATTDNTLSGSALNKSKIYFNEATIKLEYDKVTITKRDQSFCPKIISVTLKDGTKIPDGQYTVTYSNHFCAGTANVKIFADTDEFCGRAATTFTILPLDLKDAKITLDKYEFESSCNDIIPQITVEGFPLGSWKYSIKDNRNPGTATITIEGDCESLVGQRVITFRIVEKKWSQYNDTGSGTETVSSTASETTKPATAEPVKPAASENKPTQSKQTITVKARSYTKTVGNSAFSLGAKAKTKLSYKSSNTSVATVSSTGKVTIKGAGKAVITVKAAETKNYKAATQTVTITVKPKSAVIKSTYVSGKKTTIRCSSQITGISGIQIGYRTANGKEVYKTVSATSLKNLSITLNGKGKYQIRIRTWKTSGGEKIYSNWSATKTVKVS